MGDFVFNVAKGRARSLHDRVKTGSPADSALVIVLLKTAAADATLIDQDDLDEILTGGSVEADFTNYARKVLVGADIDASVVDDANDRAGADLPDQTWTAAGGASNNTLAKLLVCYDPDTTGGTDADIIPIAAFDFVITTTGGPLNAEVHAGGYIRAA